MSEEFKNAILWKYRHKPNVILLWLHLLISASDKDTIVEDTEVKRGQLITTIRQLIIDTGLTKSQIETVVKFLVSQSEILWETNKKRNTLVTICKYDSYEYQSETNKKPIRNQSETKDKEINRENETKETTEREISSLSDSPIFIEKENKEKKEKETNKETELFPEITDVILSVRTDDIDYKKVVDLWNNICGNFFGKVVKLTKSRKDKIKVRAAEIKKDSNDLYETLTRIFTLMTESDFFRNKWHPSFDWVMENDKNYIKVLEGNYNRKIVDINGNSEEAMLARLAKGEQYLTNLHASEAAYRAEFGSIFD